MENRILISKQLEKSALPGSVILTDAMNEAQYVSVSGSNQYIGTDASGTPGVFTLPSGGSVTVQNGLTDTGGGVLELGGALLHDTVITAADFNLQIIDTLADGRVNEWQNGNNIIGAGVKGLAQTSLKDGILSFIYTGDATATGGFQHQSNTGVINFGTNENAQILCSANGTIYNASMTASTPAGQANIDATGIGTAQIYTSSSGNGHATMNFDSSVSNPTITLSVWDNTYYQQFIMAGNTVQLTAYPQTRDDSSVTTPVNALYTDNDGRLQSAPASTVVCSAMASFPDVAVNNDLRIICHSISGIPNTHEGFIFDVPGNFYCVPAPNDETQAEVVGFQYSGGNTVLPAPVLMTDAVGMQAAIDTLLLPALNAAIGTSLIPGDIIYEYSGGQAKVWYNLSALPAPAEQNFDFLIATAGTGLVCDKIYPPISIGMGTGVNNGCGKVSVADVIPEAGNGLNKTTVYELGGSLSHDTLIGGNSTFRLTLGSATDKLGKFLLYSSNDVQIIGDTSASLQSGFNAEVVAGNTLILTGNTEFRCRTPKVVLSTAPRNSVLTLMDAVSGASEFTTLKYSSLFFTGAWAGAGPYSLSFPAATHGLGGGYKHVTVFDAADQIVSVGTVKVSPATGDVTIINATPFNGAVYIS